MMLPSGTSAKRAGTVSYPPNLALISGRQDERVVDRRQIEAFLRTMDAADRWLRMSFSGGSQPSTVLRMVDALRRYIRQSRRYALGPHVDQAERDRRRVKANKACMILWRSQFDQ